MNICHPNLFGTTKPHFAETFKGFSFWYSAYFSHSKAIL